MANQIKFCPSCGGKLPEPAPKFCPFCGNALSAVNIPANAVPAAGTKTKNPVPEKIGFGKAISLFWSRYFDFGGKSSRAEFWWAQLFLILVYFGIAILFFILLPFGLILLCLFTLSVIIPSWSLLCRRFRDANASINFWIFFVLQFVASFLNGIGMNAHVDELVFVGGGFSWLLGIYSLIVCCSSSVVVLEKGNSVPETVKIPDRDFSIGKFPVTRQEYFDVMEKDPSEFESSSVLPVENISWNDAVAFCEKLTKYAREKGLIKNNQSYRLPTAAEWEYACRAGTTTKYCSGDSKEDLSRVGWWLENSDDKTHPVGEKEANAWGIYDMHGNVWEWCQDSKDLSRVRCGGGYFSSASYCKSSSVGVDDPGSRHSDFGFRVVLAPI